MVCLWDVVYGSWKLEFCPYKALLWLLPFRIITITLSIREKRTENWDQIWSNELVVGEKKEKNVYKDGKMTLRVTKRVTKRDTKNVSKASHLLRNIVEAWSSKLFPYFPFGNSYPKRTCSKWPSRKHAKSENLKGFPH